MGNKKPLNFWMYTSNNNNNNNDLLVIHPQSGSSLTKCTNTITLYTKFYKLFTGIRCDITIYNYNVFDKIYFTYKITS